MFVTPNLRLQIHQTYKPFSVRLTSFLQIYALWLYSNMKVPSRLIKATNFHHYKFTISSLLISEGWAGVIWKFSKWYWFFRLTMSPTSTKNFVFVSFPLILPIPTSSNYLLFEIQWYFVYHWTQLLDPSNKTRILILQNKAICRRTYFGCT
jgi:hypothetical protein